MPTRYLSIALLLLALAAIPVCAQQAASPAALRSIHAGNQAWITGMKTGQVQPIAATYTSDALDCDPAGACRQGRAAIAAALQARLVSLGRATTAAVTSQGSVQRGDFVYEWGTATAAFPRERRISGSYLTVWRRQPDGSWKIFRNLALPQSPTA
ncbi:MAG TPA: DUF4440 domain-containing protein [Terriglobales bacterium]|nr:DUF4440 domain-containing protein [Terriglobales bacterium]